MLISWQHELIPAIARAILGGGQDVPQHWPDHPYDLVWIFDRVGGGWSFAQVPQQLLAGDPLR